MKRGIKELGNRQEKGRGGERKYTKGNLNRICRGRRRMNGEDKRRNEENGREI